MGCLMEIFLHFQLSMSARLCSDRKTTCINCLHLLVLITSDNNSNPQPDVDMHCKAVHLLKVANF